MNRRKVNRYYRDQGILTESMVKWINKHEITGVMQ